MALLALWQKQNNGDLKPIAFASRYLNIAEMKYSIGELEPFWFGTGDY